MANITFTEGSGLAKLRRMHIAAGHKADDHEQKQTNNTMSMGW